MRRRAVLALIALLAAALAAWRRRAVRAGGHGQVLAEEPTPALPEPVRQLEAAKSAHAPAEIDVAAAQRTEPEAQPPLRRVPAPPADGPHFVSIPWTLADAEAADQDRQELAIRFTLLGDRMELDRIDVRETDSQVFVTVLARYDPPPPGSRSPHYGVARDATVRLGRPLGDRALVHAPDQFDELTGRA